MFGSLKRGSFREAGLYCYIDILVVLCHANHWSNFTVTGLYFPSVLCPTLLLGFTLVYVCTYNGSIAQLQFWLDSKYARLLFLPCINSAEFTLQYWFGQKSSCTKQHVKPEYFQMELLHLTTKQYRNDTVLLALPLPF